MNSYKGFYSFYTSKDSFGYLLIKWEVLEETENGGKQPSQ